MSTTPDIDQVLKLPQVLTLVAKSRSSLYQAIQDGAFPPPIRLGSRSVGWRSSEIRAWIQSAAQARGFH